MVTTIGKRVLYCQVTIKVVVKVFKVGNLAIIVQMSINLDS